MENIIYIPLSLEHRSVTSQRLSIRIAALSVYVSSMLNMCVPHTIYWDGTRHIYLLCICLIFKISKTAKTH